MQRIVSLCPSLTELVFDLGCGDDLVGITTYCVHPADGVARVEKVGGTKTPDVERIIALAPDLVLMNEEENRSEDAAALAAAGLVCQSSLPRTIPETTAMVRRTGAALGKASEAEEIARVIEATAARVVGATRGKRPVRFAYLIWRKPWMSVNADTYASNLLVLAGGENVFSERLDRYPELTLSELQKARVDAVFLATEPFPFELKHAAELARLTGISESAMLIADGELLSWHGSRSTRGLDYAEHIVRTVREGKRD